MILMITVLMCNINYKSLYVQGQEISSTDTVNEDTDEEDLEFIETEDTDCEDENFEEVEETKRIELHTEITAKWDHHYNANVTITNLSDTRIDDWEITVSFQNKIEHIWNAKISDVDSENDRYTIKSADWNQDIEKDGSVTFGMTVCYEDEMDEMKDYYLTRICLEADVDYDVDYKEYSRWDNKVNGEIVITNHSDRRIEDWKLGLTSNLLFEQVWNAEYIDDEAEDVLDNMGYNQNIEPGQSVSFGFIAVCEDENIEFDADTLYEMITIPEELEGNPNWEDEYEMEQLAYYDYYPDDFESEADYEEYVAKRNELGLEIPTYKSEDDDQPEEFEEYPEVSANQINLFSLAKAGEKTDNKKKTLRLNSGAIEAKFINAGKKGIQSYYKSGGYMYAVQHYTDGIKITKCAKSVVKKETDIQSDLRKIWDIHEGDVVYDLSSKKNEVMELTGFHHGQTLEMFSYKNETYMMVTAGKTGKAKWGDKIAILKFSEGKLKYGDVKTEKKNLTLYITGIQYANKSHKSKGSIQHVEAALSENKKTLLLWSQVQEKGKSSQIQLSCLRMSDVMPQLEKARNKAHKKNKIATKSCKNISSKSFICTAMQSKEKGNFGKPNGSFQALDITNQENGKYRIFVAGGNDDCGYKCSVMVSTIDKKGVSKIYKPRNVTSSLLGLSTQKEMEGMHYYGDKVHFILTAIPKKKVAKEKNTLMVNHKKVALTKGVQVLYQVDEEKVDRR